MASESKEENVLRIILENSPLKQWHFEEIVRESKVTRTVANKWIKRYYEDGLIKKIKEKNRFPYFIAGSDNLIYQSKKRIYSIQKLYESGLINHLSGLENARTVILFGSFAKGDWYKDSDIDVFIFGSIEGMQKHKYELKLKRRIEVHMFKTKKEIRQVRTGLINNVVNGYLIKGQIQDFAEVC